MSAGASIRFARRDDLPRLWELLWGLATYERWTEYVTGNCERLAPHEPVNQWRHNDTGEDNADSHIKRQVMGREVVVAITGGRLDFGPWEQIFYGEFDGRRKKRVLVKVIGE